MMPEMSQPDFEQTVAPILVVVLVVFIIGFVVFVFWWPIHKEKELALTLCRLIGLTPASGPEFAAQFIGTPNARGATGLCNGMPIGVVFSAYSSEFISPYTHIAILWPCPNAAIVAIQNRNVSYTLGLSSPPLHAPLSTKFVGFGPAAELLRVFGPATQQMLLGFPRELVGIGCDANKVWLSWDGVECDRLLLEHAIRIMIQVAQIRSGHSTAGSSQLRLHFAPARDPSPGLNRLVPWMVWLILSTTVVGILIAAVSWFVIWRMNR
jgi:hypothetical protein